MSDPSRARSRALPSQPNLRYLKLEAKRRLAAGEFTTLHDAQLATAREHGLPSWTALKQHIESQAAQISATAGQGAPSESYALDQVRWVMDRFAGADGPGWGPPDEGELREHFTEHFLTVIPAGQVVSTLSGLAPELRAELSVTAVTTGNVHAVLPGLQIQASTEPEPPHRLIMLAAFPDGDRITDARLAAASSYPEGDVPAAAEEIAAATLTELALPALVLAGHGPDGAEWVLARGWADLDQQRALRPDHRFPAYSITKLVTAVAVLRLVAEGAVRLDAPANDFLRPVRLADADATVRELLTHTAGTATPSTLFADAVPDLETLTGPVLGSLGPRGTFGYSNGGYAVLGQLIADVSGEPYDAAATRLVLRPLGLAHSSFPVRWPDDPDAVTGYGLADRAFQPVSQICALPAAGGLWSTGADLLRFARGWRGLLPADLAAEAVRPQVTRPDTGLQVGLGWLVNATTGVLGHAGGGQGGASSLIVRPAQERIHVALTSRFIPIERVNARVLKAVS
jgi:CubicO group peptidase (beta-lactamase class C family)